jgi:hypothetical protein
MRKIFALSLLVALFSGCIEDYDLKRNEIEPRLVVEGLITNKQGPYYIRLTESNTGSFEPDSAYTPAPVKNAKLIISDNVNQSDTLVPVDFDIHDYNNVINTIFLTDPTSFTYDRGFYKTQHLIGIPGRTYSLKVLYLGKEYQASAFMPPVPDIDSIGFVKKVMEKDNAEYFVPLLYFSEPQGIKNYYLIQLNDEVSSRTFSASTLWQFSILSDEFLQPYVNGLNISQGETPRSIEYPIYMEGDSVYVALSSLTQNAY